MAKTRLCIVCHKRPPEVPDRLQMGRPIKRVCLECHRERLEMDLFYLCQIPKEILDEDPKYRTATEIRQSKEI